MGGVRLDSGDLAYLSIEARKILDENGFPNAVIVASNELDETIIHALKEQGARINVWGVGTKLITAHDQPALGGVYKLSSIRGDDGRWKNKVKLSEQAAKVSSPGIQQVRRYQEGALNSADVIYDIGTDLRKGCVMIDPLDSTRQKAIAAETAWSDLLVPLFRKGKCVYSSPSLQEIRQRARQELQRLHSGIKRFVHPHQYPVGLEKSLHEMKTDLILRARARKG